MNLGDWVLVFSVWINCVFTVKMIHDDIQVFFTHKKLKRDHEYLSEKLKSHTPKLRIPPPPNPLFLYLTSVSCVIASCLLLYIYYAANYPNRIIDFIYEELL